MASFLNFSPHLVLSAFQDPTRNPNPLLFRTPCPQGLFTHHRTLLPGASVVARAGFNPGFFADPESAEVLVREVLGRAEGFLYTIADAAVSSTAADSVVDTKQSSDWFSGIAASMENVLKVLKDGLSGLHVPYSYGFAIILLTVIVKAATFPLTKKQVESAMAMRSLQPQIKAIQERYAGDQERTQLEIARVYKLAGINPLAGCLPTLFTIPVWIGLYRALSNVANEGLLTEGFFWIPSLSGPTTIASRQSGSGISWLFPFVDGHPPLGWPDTLAYLVLPVLLIVSQYISVQIMQSSQGNDPNLKNSQVITKFLPLLIGYFALSVPSGLSLYWFTNNMLSTAQQIWLQKLGGAKIPARDFSRIISKDDDSLIQNSMSGRSSAQLGSGEGEKPTPTPKGPQPGERFKQLKEEEARKKQQREEAMKKAGAAAVDNTRITDEEHLAEVENGTVCSDEVKSTTHTLKSSNGVVNGHFAEKESKTENENASHLKITNGSIPANKKVNESGEQQSCESLVQDNAVESCAVVATQERKSSGEDLPQVKPNVHAEKEE